MRNYFPLRKVYADVSVLLCAVPPELQGSELFHAIHLGASVEAVPAQFVRLLKPGGRLVAPLGAMHGAAPQVNRKRSIMPLP